MIDLPTSARVVIIGGGISGCSVAYHLTALGWTDVMLLERKQLTSGTTWHAAGLVGQLQASQNRTRLAKYSADLYGRLEAETGLATGFRQCGSITVALSAERREEILRLAAMARAFDVEVNELSPAEVAAMYPRLNVEGVVAGVHLPADGQADPANVALALAKGARARGARIVEQVKVTAVTSANGRVTGVDWEAGEANGHIAADLVVNCGGMWGRDLAARNGVTLPLHACEHFYIVTEPIPGLERLPVLRVPEECAYYKEDAGKILLGAFEPVAKPWGMEGIREDFCFDQLPEDFDHFEPILEKAIHRMPMLAEAGIHTFFNGPESFTPDDRYYLGEAPELAGYWVAAGYNSIGIASAGGAGMALARWMDEGAAALRSLGSRHPPRPAVPAQPTLSARARHRDARPALRRSLSLPPDGVGPGSAPLAASRAPGRPGRGLRRGGGMGARQLVRRARRSAGVSLHLGPSELVREPARRTYGAPRGGRAHRHVLLRQDPGGGPGRPDFPPAPLRQRDRRGGGADRLHADAQRTWRHRKRPDGQRASRRRPSSSSFRPRRFNAT